MSTALAMAQAEARTFKVRTPDGVMISAQEWGNREGFEIVLIHGFSQSHLSWSRQFGSALAKSFRIITYDIRGHGGSEKPLDAVHYRDHKRWAGELNAVMEGAKLKRPVLVGWSYGSRILVEYLMEYGDINIAGINFVGAFTKVVPELLGAATPAVMKMVSESPADNIESTRSFLQFSTAKALPPDELEMMLAYNMEVPARVRRHLLHRPAAYEVTLRKITVPVLVTHGIEDRVALVPMARYTESVVANAQVSLYDGVGHMPFWEDASRFNRELGEFVIKANLR